jgi:hypothetical protein
VDTDGDGDTEDDADAAGASLELVYTENYNPTVKLMVNDANGTELGTWHNMVRNDFTVGQAVLLDGADVLVELGLGGVDVAHVEWTQQHMEHMSFEYMTENEAVLLSPLQQGARVSFDQPGKYVFGLHAVGTAGQAVEARVAAWVVKDFGASKLVGTMPYDVWNESYDPQTGNMIDCGFIFSDSDAQRKLAFLREQGVENVVVMNQSPLMAANPLPRLDLTEAPMQINHEDLEMVFREIEQGHLFWQAWYADSNDWVYFTDPKHLTEPYLEEYFRQFREQVVSSAGLATELGLKSIGVFGHPLLWWVVTDLEATNPALARWLGDQWIALFDEIRTVFSGLIGCTAPRESAITKKVVQHVDFIEDSVGNYASYFSSTYGWVQTMPELRMAYSSLLAAKVWPLARAFGKPVWLVFEPPSYEGSTTRIWEGPAEQANYEAWRYRFTVAGHTDEMFDGATNPNYVPSFREQVRFIEALLPVVADSSDVAAVIARGESWRLVSYDDFAPQSPWDYFTLPTGSLQGKPGFEVYRLWASMLDPNERLLYRCVHAPVLQPTTL